MDDDVYTLRSELKRLLYVKDSDWRDQAACKGMDPDLFHPVEHDRVTEAMAKETCDRCPVSGECLDYALKANEAIGIWGGESGRRRQKLRAARRRDAS